jgi:selenophosphate synthase
MDADHAVSESEVPVTDIGLSVIAEATALHTGDDDALVASEDNLHEVVDNAIDEPLTEQQEQVVDALAASAGSIAAGLAAVVSKETGKPVSAVLGAAAQALEAHRD